MRGLQAAAELPAGRVAGEVAVGVVDLLEVVDVEHDQRQRPPVALRARDLALEQLVEEPLVVDAGQAVEDRQAVDLLVVGALDVGAGQELQHRLAEAHDVAVVELRRRSIGSSLT